MNGINLVTDALAYYDANNDKYQNSFKNVRYTKFIAATSDMEHNIIIMYDNDKNEIYRSRYEIIGLFNKNSSSWIWGWAIPSFRKNNTHIVRKIFNYGADLDPESKFLKLELITSRFRIADPIQLDMHVSIASYISKKPLIYNHYVYNEQNDSDLYDIKQNSENKSDKHTIWFMFLLDNDKLKLE